MIRDDEGFVYPEIDTEKCVHCRLCENNCPVLNPVESNGFIVRAYAALNKNEQKRASSSSGGVFVALAEHIIENTGVVYGVAFDEQFQVGHVRIEKKEDIHWILGSKYVQSNAYESFESVKKDVLKGRQVLFSGTPCQIAGLQKYLSKEYDNLLIVDIACHGVPSALVWKKYLAEYVLKDNRIVQFLNFRDKKTGWKEYSFTYKNEGGSTFSQNHNQNPYMLSFMLNYSLRPSCFLCKFKGLERASDITLADFWGIEKIAQAMDDDKGTSLILVNSTKGQNVLREVASKLECHSVEVKEAVEQNRALFESARYTPKREVFFKYIKSGTFEEAYKKASHTSIIERIIRKIYRICKIVLVIHI